MRACQHCIWAASIAGSSTGSGTVRPSECAAAGDGAVKVCEAADGFTLLADAVMLGQVGCDRERQTDEVVEVDDRRVLSGTGDDVEYDVGA
jgi:hypothetical protein